MEEARKEKSIDALNMAASFKTVAEDWFATRVSGWSESYTKQVRSALEKDVYPVLGKRSIVDITARDVLALLQKKERTAPEQARNYGSVSGRSSNLPLSPNWLTGIR